MCYAPSREIASAVARSLAPTESQLRVIRLNYQVAPQSCTYEERSPAATVALNGARDDHNQRGTPHAHAATARAVSAPKRQQAQWRAGARDAKAGCAKRRPQLTRRTTVLHRRREAARWCRAVAWRMGWLQPTRDSARARHPNVLRLLARDSDRACHAKADCAK